MKRNLIAFGVLSLLCSSVMTAQAPSPSAKLVGKWKLNLAKSTYSPGPKPGTGYVQVNQWTIRPDGFIVATLVTINAEGVPTFNQTVSKYDGKDYPVYGSAALVEFQVAGTKLTTIAYKIRDEYSVELTGKGPDGKVTNPNQTRIRTVSRDGMSMTDATKGTNAQGQAINNVLFFDRIP